MNVVTKPRVVLIASTHFNLATALSALDGDTWVGVDDATDAELLSEYSGRVCYDAFGPRQGRKNTADYLHNILAQRHGSVLEHASATFYVQGVSRSLTHEWIRHRHLSPSQRSQRYVAEDVQSFVLPPDIGMFSSAYDIWEQACRTSHDAYVQLVDILMKNFEGGYETKMETRKAARQAARSVLPNATETKVVMTGNLRSWRNTLLIRGSKGVEPEIRRLQFALLPELRKIAPAVFADFTSDGEYVTSKFGEV